MSQHVCRILFNSVTTTFKGFVDLVFFMCINMIPITSLLRRIEKENNQILQTKYELFDFVLPLLKTVFFQSTLQFSMKRLTPFKSRFLFPFFYFLSISILKAQLPNMAIFVECILYQSRSSKQQRMGDCFAKSVSTQ